MDALLSTGALPVGDTGYEIDNSLKFERANSEKLARTPSSASNSKTWTYSFWLKRTQLGINSYHLEAKGTGDKFFILGFNENDQILFYDIFSDDYGKAFTRRFRDTGAWYHIVLRADTTDGTAGNRMRLYVNGVQETDVATDYGDFPQNHDTQINKAVVHNIGYRTDINQYGSGYIAETCLIDGTSLGPDSFGEFDSDTGIWKPIDVSGLTFGTNGFYQDYKTGADLGADKVSGGNSNDYTETNITAADQATDTPTNNFCTLNPLFRGKQAGSPVISDGASKHNGSGGWDGIHGTMGFNKGKWYWEAKTQSGNHSDFMYGIQTADAEVNTNTSAHNLLSTAVWYVGGAFWIKDSTSGRDDVASGSITHTVGSSVVYGIALNMDDGEVTYYANGSVVSGLNGINIDGLDGLLVMPMVSFYNVAFSMNFGGYSYHSISSAASDANGYGTFEYAPPSGYYALCTKNLEEYG